MKQSKRRRSDEKEESHILEEALAEYFEASREWLRSTATEKDPYNHQDEEGNANAYFEMMIKMDILADLVEKVLVDER